MEIIPAIDIKDGRCVRLTQGKFDQEEVFSDDPVGMALYWQKQGAERIHIVDLDGAKEGKPCNLSLIKKIIENISVPVQLGGGVRTAETIKLYLKAGVERVILGTIALKDPQLVKDMVKKYGAEKIVVGVDAKEGKVAVEGWLETSEQTVEETVKKFKESGVTTFIYTDISRDGMLTGPDFDGLKELLAIGDVEIIASGGVSSEDDLEQLDQLGIKSAIVGKALYSGELDYSSISRGVNYAD